MHALYNRYRRSMGAGAGTAGPTAVVPKLTPLIFIYEAFIVTRHPMRTHMHM